MRKQANNRIRQSIGSRAFDVFNYGFIAFLCFTILFPMLYLLTLSLSTPADVSFTQLVIWPKKIVFNNYKVMFQYSFTATGFKMSVLRVLLGTIIELTLCSMTAYPLAKRDLPFRTVFTSYMVITMFVSGGLIPQYLNIRNLGLIDTIWSLVLHNAIPTYSMLIMRNYFMALPIDMEEAASIDGAGQIRILAQIILPCSKPIMATIALWCIVGHWNAWFDSNIYIRTATKLPLQNILRTIVDSSSIGGNSSFSAQGINTGGVNTETLRAAAVMITTFPIICVYPFLQKYFVKGVLVGSLKG